MAIDELTPRQRAHLRSRARALKPALQIGKGGVTESVGRSVEAALAGRERLKIKVLGAAPQGAREVGEDLAGRLPNVHLVQVVGRTLVLYRPRPEAPEIAPPP